MNSAIDSRESEGIGEHPGPERDPGNGLESPGEVSRIAKATPELIRRYLKAGLISCVVDASGRRSFPQGTGQRVRALKADRMDRRRRGGSDALEGRHTGAAPTTVPGPLGE